MSNTNLQTGEAAEYFVAYKLMRLGYAVDICQQSSKYDLIAHVNNRPIRIQVKSASEAINNSSYKFITSYGSVKKETYAANDFDIIAYVALDKDMVVFSYAPPVTKTVTVGIDKFSHDSADITWKMALRHYSIRNLVKISKCRNSFN